MDDQRDYAEEAANEWLLATGDGETTILHSTDPPDLFVVYDGDRRVSQHETREAAERWILDRYRRSREPKQTHPFRVKIEQTASGKYTGTVVGPGIDFPEIVWGETREECIAEAKRRVEWIKTRQPPEEFEL